MSIDVLSSCSLGLLQAALVTFFVSVGESGLQAALLVDIPLLSLK